MFKLSIRILVCLLIVGVSPLLATPTIEKANRVVNRTDHGVCWWACAEMIGKQYKIKPLLGLVDKVVESEIGFKEGATSEAIAYWMQRHGVNVESINDKKKYEFVLSALRERNLPVLTSNYWFNSADTHAIILLDVTYDPVDFVDEDGTKQHAHKVTYINPNSSADHICQRTWAWWYTSFTGKAYVFDPARQKDALVPLPIVKDKAETYIKPPTQPVPLPPPPPLLQLVTQPAGSLPKVRSNQDIKDGVNRPDDLLRYGCYDYLNHNYYLTPKSKQP